MEGLPAVDYSVALKPGEEEPHRFQEAVVASLEDLWAEGYQRSWAKAEFVIMTQGDVTYLFDKAETTEHCARTIAAYGRVSLLGSGRDVVYQAAFPLPTMATQQFDRGHMMPHSAGGQFGPNIYAQDRALNRGLSAQGRRYRSLERKAITSPDSVFFCHLRYSDTTDIPASVDLGLVSRGIWKLRHSSTESTAQSVQILTLWNSQMMGSV